MKMVVTQSVVLLVATFFAAAEAWCVPGDIAAAVDNATISCGNLPLDALTMAGDGFNPGAPMVPL